MTVSTQANKAQFNGAGSAGPFTFNFRFFNNSEIFIVKTSVTGVDSSLTETVDYALTGAGSYSGGSITLTSSLAIGEKLTVYRVLPLTQTTDLRNQGAFFAEVHEDVFDRLTMIVQQQDEAIDRALQLSVATPDGVDVTLPSPEANNIIGWDNTGSALKNFNANELATVVSYGTAISDIFTGDGTTTDFTLSFDPANINNLDVSVGGVSQLPGTDYTRTSGTTLTMTTAVPNDVKLLVRYMRALPQGTVDWGSVSSRPFIDYAVNINSDMLASSLYNEINMIHGGSFTVASGMTFTIDVPFSCGPFQCFAGDGDVVLPAGVTALPEWWGTVDYVSIGKAIASVATGGTVLIDSGDVTLADTVAVDKSVVINLGKTSITANLTSQMFLVKASGVTFEGAGPALSKMENTNTVSGNIIQWGARGEAHTYTDLTVKHIQFTLPVITNAIDTYRTQMGAIVAVAESLSALTPNYRLTVKDCIFNEGADQISIEHVNQATIENNIFNTSKGRGVLLWNCDYYKINKNTLMDPAGTAVNLVEGFYAGALNKANDYGSITDNIVYGTRYEGIQLKGSHTHVTGNRLFDVRGVGIGIGGAGNSANIVLNSIVSNNTIHVIGGGVGASGISLIGGATYGPQHIDISNNRIRMSASGQQGILLSGVSTNQVEVKQNSIFATGLGAALNGIQVNNITNVSFKSNTIEGFTGNGIYVNSSASAEMVSNTIKNNTLAGIKLDFSSTHNYTGYISDNYIVGGTTGISIGAGVIASLRVPNTNRYLNQSSSEFYSGAYTYLGDQTRIDGAVIPASGYIKAGEIVYRGSGQVGGASSGWVCTTAGYLLKGAWTTGTAYITGYMVSNGGNIYQATNSGTSGATPPTHLSGDVSDGVVTWRFVAVGTAAVVKALPAIAA